MRLSKPELLLGLCGFLLIGLTAIGLTLPQPVIGQFGIGYGKPLDHFVILGCVQGLIYFAAVALVLRITPSSRMVWGVLAFAALSRLIVVAIPPFLSNDIYRYVWDGWVQGAGINPYRYIPADPHLSFLRDTIVFPNINRADYAHTIYPPAAEMIFCAVAGIAKIFAAPPVLAMKLAMLAFEAIGILAMLRLLDRAGLPRARILIYVWNPLPLWEFAGSGHVDAIAICFIALALLAAADGKRGWSAAALATATLTKFLPVILLPALWRRWDWKFAAIFAALIVVLYLPYLSVGNAVFGFLGGYNAQEGIDSGAGVFLLSVLGQAVALPAVASKLYLIALAMTLLALGAVMVFGQKLPASGQARTRMIAKNALLLGCALMVGISPHYPWYYCWLLIPACIVPWSGALYLVTAAFLLYLNPTHTQLFWPALLYGPFFALAAWDVWAKRGATPLMNLKFAEGDRT
jgi:alpha-1,6-mannosyltransferase